MRLWNMSNIEQQLPAIVSVSSSLIVQQSDDTITSNNNNYNNNITITN